MLKKAVQQGRLSACGHAQAGSKRRGEAYGVGTLSLFVKRERRWRTLSASCERPPIKACESFESSSLGTTSAFKQDAQWLAHWDLADRHRGQLSRSYSVYNTQHAQPRDDSGHSNRYGH
jgi:hypothetical protein